MMRYIYIDTYIDIYTLTNLTTDMNYYVYHNNNNTDNKLRQSTNTIP